MSLRHHYWTEAEYQQVVKNWAKGRVEGHSPAPLGPPREWKARHPIPADSKASVVAQPVSSPAPSPVIHGYRKVAEKWGKNMAKAGRSLQSENKRVASYGASAVPSPFGNGGYGLSQEFFVPGPLPGMNDIVRKNHYVYSAMKKRWSRTIATCLLHAKILPMQRVAVIFTWVERNTRRDPDNILAGGQKLILDCLVTTGTIPNDGWANIVGLAHNFTIDASNPGVWVVLHEVSV